MFGIEFLIILFIAAFIQAAIGFGYGAVFIGICALMMPLDQVILMSFVFGPLIQLLLILITIKYRLSWDGLMLALLALIGVPVGVVLFNHLDIKMLQLLFGLFLMGTSVLSFSGRQLFSANRSVFYGIGAFSGVLAALFGSSGPFISLYLLTRPELKRVNHIFILNMVFFVLGVVLFAWYFWQGQYDFLTQGTVLKGLFSAVLGTLLGYFFGGYFSNQVYRRLVLMVIFLMGVLLIGDVI